MQVIFTGGQKTESVKLWDPRNKRVMYELATGNNSVTSIAWNARDTTLYAATECDYLDRLGSYHGYRPAKPLNHDKKDDEKPKEEKKAAKRPVPKSRKAKPDPKREEDEPEDEDDEYDSDDEESDCSEESDDDPYKDWDGVKCWPDRAYHMENFFGEMFDAGDSLLCALLRLHRATYVSDLELSPTVRYQFKENADPSVIPQYGHARLSSEDEAPGCPTQ